MKKLLLVPLCIALVQCSIAQNTWTQKANFGGTERIGATGFSIGSKGYIGTGLAFDEGTEYVSFKKD